YYTILTFGKGTHLEVLP
uniref:Uncharacterized protein n=1 Tax=Sarcophilus harrisii TaxID=9305 RepID=A0A7N4NHI2_SARHA